MNSAAAQPAYATTMDQEAFVPPTLVELLEDGTTLLLLIRGGLAPKDRAGFSAKVATFLATFERQAAQYGKTPALVADAKYAFCALFDEVVLSTGGEFGQEWARSPLQLLHFGDHLAGEGFFHRLDRLRMDPAQNIEALEVYYTCLLLGFKGRYLLEGPELLGLLLSRLRQEVLSNKGGEAEFAPHAQPAHRFNDFLRHDIPVWVYLLFFVGAALLFFLVFKTILHFQLTGLS